MAPPTLHIFSGLPGTGKTTLSRRLAARIGAVHLRVDTIEQALREVCGIQVEGEGYRLAYRIAADNLRLGLSVVADSCNPIELTRREWEEVARTEHAPFVNIEIVCSDSAEHRRRVEDRQSRDPSRRAPTWDEIVHREYAPWRGGQIVIDTSRGTPEAAFSELCSKLDA